MLIHVVTANQAEMAKAFSHTIAHGFSLSGSSLLPCVKVPVLCFFFSVLLLIPLVSEKRKGKFELEQMIL
jgi:hypothetical protein